MQFPSTAIFLASLSAGLFAQSTLALVSPTSTLKNVKFEAPAQSTAVQTNTFAQCKWGECCYVNPNGPAACPPQLWKVSLTSRFCQISICPFPCNNPKVSLYYRRSGVPHGAAASLSCLVPTRCDKCDDTLSTGIQSEDSASTPTVSPSSIPRSLLDLHSIPNAESSGYASQELNGKSGIDGRI
ncbi:hypothetical protein VTL71DRAFT_12451 [Oculimacula yallundae]|uniref:Uncharacterized protein n=1 Tax=Oculimacula yallundae TaxID=86028 RepID=A0ABR4CML1_9HELO